MCIPGEGEPLFHKDVVKELVEYNNSIISLEFSHQLLH